MAGRADVTFDERLALLDESRLAGRHEAIVSGIRFNIDPEVFSPRFFESTRAFAEMLPSPAGQRFLEVGTGCGVLAVLAAMRGALMVTATDISPAAVANARRNVARHQLDHVVEVVESDVYDRLVPGCKFDAIFWNAPWVSVPEDYQPESVLERAICDPGYAGIWRFFDGATAFLSSTGSVMIGLGSFGDVDRILALAEAAELEQVHCESRGSATQAGIDYSIYRFRPASAARANWPHECPT